MKQVRKRVPVFAAILLFTGLAVLLNFTTARESQAAGSSISSSLGVVPYPAKGQTPEKQNDDEGACYGWARQQTGIDPAAMASTPTSQPGAAVGGRERVRGAAGGAAAGAAIGAIAGDAGAGAGIGAVAGTLVGGSRARRNKAAQEAQAEQTKSATLQTFNRAFGACMEGRGYTIK